MKKSLIGTLALGLVIGVVALGVKAFANEKEVATQSFTTNVNPVVSNIDQNSSAQGESQFIETIMLDKAARILIMEVMGI